MDKSRNHIEAVEKRIEDLNKIIALNDKCLKEYAEFLTPEYIRVVEAQNELMIIERDELKKELEDYES